MAISHLSLRHALSIAIALLVAPAAALGAVRTAHADFHYASRGYDISWPQCAGTVPGPNNGFGVVGVTNGRPYGLNPCFAEQVLQWGPTQQHPASLYVNLEFYHDLGPMTQSGPGGNCGPGDVACPAYNWGYHAAQWAMDQAKDRGIFSKMWWLDVEDNNYWSADQGQNTMVVRGAIQSVQDRGYQVGIYSSWNQWQDVTNGWRNGLAQWVAGPGSYDEAQSWCTPSQSFTGGPIWMVQYPDGDFDGDIACVVIPGWMADPPAPAPPAPAPAPVAVRAAQASPDAPQLVDPPSGPVPFLVPLVAGALAFALRI